MKTSPVTIVSLFLCVVFTIIFTLLAVMKTSGAKPYLGKEPGTNIRPIPELSKEIAAEETKLAEAEKSIAIRLRELDRIDLELARRGVAYASSDARLLADISSPDRPRAVIEGKDQALKASTWQLTADHLTTSARHIDAKRLEQGNDAVAPLDEAIRKRQDELQDVLKRIGDRETQFTKDRDALNKQLEDMTTAKDKTERQRREDVSRRATRIAQLEDEIRNLLELNLTFVGELQPDGRILESTDSQVIINLGDTDRVTPGTRFTAFTYVRGRYVEKGLIEVVSSSRGISRCRVISHIDARHDPVSKGDQIGSPLYDRDRPRVVAVAGEFQRYNKADIEQFLRDSGVTVVATLGPNCDYLIAGDRSDREQAAARQYQVTAMTEAQALTWLQARFAPKTK